MCGEDRGFTLIQLTREIKYSKPQGKGEKEGRVSKRLKPTDSVTMTSQRQAKHVETNNVARCGRW